MQTTTIGWIGLGKMGNPMSQQLIQAGYKVAVYNRTKEKEAALVQLGALSMNDPEELIHQADIVIIMVSDDAAVHSVFTGAGGLLRGGSAGKIMINMSTISPALSRELADLCHRQGSHYMDAPVSGSVKQAETGQLVIMAGGDELLFDQVAPILKHMGKLVMRVGEIGAGNTAKLAINTLLSIYAQGLAETVLMAKRNGINAEDLLTLIGNSALGNVFTKIKGDAIVENNYTAAFALKHIAKDLRLAGQLGMEGPLGIAAYDTFGQAEALYGEEDIIAVIKQLDN